MKIGKYEVLGKIGEGGMGMVYRARDPLLDRLVAIKVISQEALDDTARLLFEREAKSIARLSHPNIVTIFEYDYWEGRPYIAMELLKGSDLDDFVDQEISLQEKLEIVVQICNGLFHAHSENIIHRDIKPANIFILPDGTVKITDFGVARLTASTLTRDMVFGTPEYIAPERWQSGEIDARSDIFSLGVLLYWLLTGVNPFSSEEVPNTFYKIMNETPPPPDLGLPESFARLLQHILDRSLAKEVEERYPDLSEMASDLRMLIAMLSTTDFEEQPDEETQNIHRARIPTPKPVSSPLPKKPLTGKKQEIKDPPRTSTKSAEAPTLVVSEKTAVLSKKERPAVSAASQPASKDRKRSTLILMMLLFAGLAVTYFLWRKQTTSNQSLDPAVNTAPAAATRPVVSLGIAYSSEKKQWLETNYKGFSTTPAGRGVEIHLIPMGSREAADAVIAGDKRIHAWSPASEAHEGWFLQEWQKKYSLNPISKKENLALTPMVFLMWRSRYEAFIHKYKTLSFGSLVQAIDLGTWEAIAGKPEWGTFRFGFTDPKICNDGFAALLVLAHEHFKDPVELNPIDFSKPGFQRWMQTIRKHNSHPIKDSARLTERMISEGPSSFDVIFTYESLAAEYLKTAEGRWEPLRIAYPGYNIWSENPYYVLDLPWSTPDQREAAEKFLDYLLTHPVQENLMHHGYRPGNIHLPIHVSKGPMQELSRFGLQFDPITSVDPPDPSTVQSLLKHW